MEIKETNSIMNFLTGNKPSGVANSVGADFLSLLSDKTGATSESKKSLSQQVAGYSSKDSDKGVPFAREDKSKISDAKKNRSGTDDKASSSSRDKLDKVKSDDKVNTGKDRDVKKVDSEVETPSNVVADKTTKEQVNVSDEKVVAVDSVKSQADVSTDESVVEVDDTVGQKLVSLEALALMGFMNIVNPSTGVVETKTGAELAAQFSSDSGVAAVQLIASADGSLVVKSLSVEQLKQLESQSKTAGLPIDGMDMVADGETVNLAQAFQVSKDVPIKTQEATVLTEGLVDEKIVQQADEIGGMLGDDKKLNIKVSVKEEKFAYQTSSDLIADTSVVDEVVNAKSDAKINAATLPKDAMLVQNNVTVANPQSAVTANAAIVAASGASVAQVVENFSVSTVAVKSVEASSSGLSQAASSGSEFVNASKQEAINADNKASFRDVYKGMSKEVVDQVKVNITKSAVRGIDKIEIQLKPEDLGNIEVKMQIKDGKLHAHIISSRPDTMDILQKDIQVLEKAFQDAGFQTDDSSLSFSFREEQQANQNQENGLRSFIGNALSEETNSDLLNSEVLGAQSYDGTSALNIRV